MNYLKKELYGLINSNEAIFDFIQESSLDGLWYWDLENVGQAWSNEKFWANLGYSLAEVKDKSQLWQTIIYPEDRNIAYQDIQAHINNPTVPFQPTLRFRHKKGFTVWLKCQGKVIFNDAGVPTRLLGTSINITKEKQKEKLLEETNRAAKVGSWEIDLKTNQLYWNDITKEIHEVPLDFQPDLATGIHFYKEGKSRDTISKCVSDAIEIGTPWDVELQIITNKGREIWVRAIGQSEFFEGQCLRVYGVFQDIDQQKRTEDKLRQLEILEAKSKEMEQFAYIASHDLREPLTTLKGYLNLLSEEFAADMPQDAKDILQFSLEGANRMDELIHGLLGYSRLSQIKVLETVDCNKVLQDVLADLSVSIKKNEVIFEIDTLPIILGHPLELKLLFQNLISNAIKFRKKKVNPIIKISYQATTKGWQFQLEDNGIGIEETETERIFYIFQRLHKNDYEGTGIGLANCKKIVELHNGEIWVVSELGVGSTFYFTILTAE